jgi:hypothetical protein
VNLSNFSEHSRPMEAIAEDPTPPQVEEAGPLGPMNYDTLETLLPPHHPPPHNPGTEEPSEQSGEQPLESHEVMELQAFSERKEWIMEKIKVGIPTPLFPLRILTILRKAPRGHASHRTLRRPRGRAYLNCGSFGASYSEATRTVAHRARQGRERNGGIRLWRTQKVQEFHQGSVPSCVLLPFFLPSRLNDRCSGLKA